MAALIAADPWKCFSAHLADGVRTTETLEGKPEQWYGLDTGLAVTPEALEWAANEDGQSYATLLAIVSGAISRLESPATGDVHALFCSMAFTEFCDRCGGNLGMKRPCPHVLATQLRLVGEPTLRVAGRPLRPPASVKCSVFVT